MLMISFFPVRYPAGFSLENIDPIPHPQNPNRECSLEIRFGNSYGESRGAHGHGAIDIFGCPGLEIIAPTSATVITSWRYQGSVRPGVSVNDTTDGGYYLRMVDHQGYVHYLAHMMQQAQVNMGQSVRAGQVLGYLGNTGRARSTCPHLHYQVKTPRRYDGPGNVNGWHPMGGRNANPYERLKQLAIAEGAQRVRSTSYYVIPAPVRRF